MFCFCILEEGAHVRALAQLNVGLTGVAIPVLTGVAKFLLGPSFF